MKKYERIISIIMLLSIGLSNVSTPAAYAAQAVVAKIPKSPKASTIPVVPPKFKQSDSGSVLGASTSLLTIGVGGTETQQSASKRIPLQVEQIPKKVYQTNEDVTISVINPDDDPFTTSVLNDSGQNANVPITQSNDGTTTTVQLAGSNEITPGEYTVKITDDQGNITTQDFSWGVLALNTDKTMYHPGEESDISMAVLDDEGSMVCDASLQLQITNSAFGINDLLSTNSASSSATDTDTASSSAQITVNPQCQQHSFSLQPDYEAHYTFAKAGTYNLQLTATTENGTHTISSSIPVTNQIPFDVQRVSATRIYPLDTYPMTFNITAHQDFNGTVTETVPEDFTITPATGSAQTNSYDDMQTVYLNSNDPAVQLQQAINASGSGGLVMPFHGDYPITQGFGAQMTDPTLQAFYTQYGLAGHDGVDFGVPMNTPLYAADDGNIIWSGPGDYGVTIIIQHSWGQSYYGHLSTTAVKVGDHVTKGELIGYSGESGEATGPHLHFGIRPNNPDMKNGYYGKVDPLPYLPYGHQEEDTSLLGPSLALPTGTITPTPSLSSSTVLSASTSANSASNSANVSETPTPTSAVTPSVIPSQSPTPTLMLSSTASEEATPTPSTSPTPTPVPNSNFSVLSKQIQENEALSNAANTEEVKVITWHVSLKKGQRTTLGYNFQAPHVSPQFYLLGPMQFYANSSNKVIFQEQRQWQIASDDVGIEWYQNTGGRKWNGYSWQYRKKLTIDHTKVVNISALDSSESTDSGAGTGGHSSPATLTTLTVSSSDVNEIIILGVSTYGSGTVSTGTPPTWDSTQTFTKLSSSTYNSGNDDVELWYLVNPIQGNHTISVTLTANSAYAIGAADYYNVNTSSPFGTVATNSGYGTSSSLTVPSGTNQLPIDVIGTSCIGSGFYPGGSQTLVWGDGPDSACTGSSYASSAGSTTTMTWSESSGPDYWYDIGVSLQPATVYNPTVTFMDSGGDEFGNNTAAEEALYPTTNDIAGGGSISVDNSKAETGSDSILFQNGTTNGTSQCWMERNGVTADSGTRSSQYVYFDNFPTQSGSYDIFLEVGEFDLGISNAGVLNLNYNYTQLGSNGPTLSAGKWYRIALSYKVASATSYQVVVYVNGAAVISYSQTSGGTSISGDLGDTGYYPGWDSNDTGGKMNYDDIYVDNGTNLSDPGNVHVTAKRPISNGTTNNFSPTGSPTGYPTGATGNAQYVSERPVDTSAYVSVSTTTKKTEEYDIESQSSGDVNLNSVQIMGTQGWIYAKESTTSNSPVAHIILNGTATLETLTTSAAMYTATTTGSIYPAGTGTDIGMDGQYTTTAGTYTLYEAGVQVAYLTNAGPLTNFPVLISLSGDTGLSAHAQSSCADVLFTDSTGENLLPFELEDGATDCSSGNLNAWVQIPSLSTTVNTIIYMYYGNPSTASLANSSSVWNGQYMGVWHMQQNPVGTAPQMLDSTSGANNGTTENMTSGNSVSGKIDKGVSFNGSNNYISMGSTYTVNNSSLTIQFWLNPTAYPTGTDAAPIVSQRVNSGNKDVDFAAELEYNGEMHFTSSKNDYTPYSTCFSPGTVPLGTWTMVTAVVNNLASQIYIYLNGALQTTCTLAAPLFNNTGSVLYDGYQWDPSNNTYYDGILDEVELSNTGISTGWIDTEYNNQSSPSTFYSVGNQETSIYAPTMAQLMRHGEWFSSEGVVQPFTF